MKKIVYCILMLFSPLLYAQDSTFKLRAIGVDFLKNLALLKFDYNLSSPIVGECFLQFSTPQPNHYFNLGFGYVEMSYKDNHWITQSFSGYFIKTSWEKYSKTGKSFSGYGGVFSYGKTTGRIDIKENYFPGYSTILPIHNGFGASLEGYFGVRALLLRRIEARFVARGALIISEFGRPKFPYVPGVGISSASEVVSFSYGGTIQLFYLTKRAPKRVTID